MGVRWLWIEKQEENCYAGQNSQTVAVPREEEEHNILSPNNFYLSNIISYMFWLIYNNHQADNENKEKIFTAEKIFRAAAVNIFFSFL
jgi:hypothetical protein